MKAEAMHDGAEEVREGAQEQTVNETEAVGADTLRKIAEGRALMMKALALGVEGGCPLPKPAPSHWEKEWEKAKPKVAKPGPAEAGMRRPYARVTVSRPDVSSPFAKWRLGGSPKPVPVAEPEPTALEEWVPEPEDLLNKVVSLRPADPKLIAAIQTIRARSVTDPSLGPPRSDVETAALEQMNRNHAAIKSIAGKFRICGWEPNPLDPSKKKIVYQAVEDFKNGYANDFIRVAGRTDADGTVEYRRDTKGNWWFTHPKRRQYDGVVFQPEAPESVDGRLNLWQGWGVEPKRGDWSLIRAHILEVVAAGNQDYFEYIWKWIAYAIQNPDKRAEVALVLIGAKGRGKGAFSDALRRIFYPHDLIVNDIGRITGRFNHQLEDCILLIADEMMWAGNDKARGQLQGLITGSTIMVEPKNVGMYAVRNMLHVVMLAEPGWVIPAGAHERRYAAFEVSDVRRMDREYFTRLYKQIEGDGPAAMFYDLGRVDLGQWHPRQLPDEVRDSQALVSQKGKSLNDYQGWWLGVLDEGRLPGAWPKKPFRAWSKGLLDGARASSGVLRDRMTDRKFADFIKSDLVGAVKERQSAAAAWDFPELAQCRAAFVKAFGPQDWPPEDDAKWIQWNAASGEAFASVAERLLGE